ncbi:YihY/virulence factor BrkB family protein [Egbenema bharatensis]|uniref:YihY/virulence factor BrkB family protein n=1 Tax=Egbenema bharatensis TaxID=3463334 RepID=UPI003A87758F
MKVSAFFPLLKETFSEWMEDKVPRLAAALSYFTVFSLAPLLVIAISVAAIFFGEDAARGQIVGQIQGLVGQEGAAAIETMITNADQVEGGVFATVLGIVTLLIGASGVFGQLQDALNTIWEVAPRPGRGIAYFIRSRFLSFGMVLVIAFLLLVSLVISAVVAGIGTYMTDVAPGLSALWELANFAISFGVITLLFALIYRVLPDVEIAWGDVWIGAAVTAFLFTVGRTLIGIYLGSAAVGSAYGAAGSLVVILVWVFYSAQILLFGAEFTQVYARRYGSRIRPAPIAVDLSDEGRVQQGIPRNEYVKEVAESEAGQAPEPDQGSSRRRDAAPPPQNRANRRRDPIEPASPRTGQRPASSPNLGAVILGSMVVIVETVRGRSRKSNRRRDR